MLLIAVVACQGRIPALGPPDGDGSPDDAIILSAPAGSLIALHGCTPHSSPSNRSSNLSLDAGKHSRSSIGGGGGEDSRAAGSRAKAGAAGVYRRMLIISYRAADCFPLYLSGERYTTEKHAHLISGRAALAARLDAGTTGGAGAGSGNSSTGAEEDDGQRRQRQLLPVPIYRQGAESLFEIQARSRRGEA